MEKLRYNRTFKQGIIVMVLCFLLFGYMFVYNVVAKIQYDDIVKDMSPLDATVVDVDLERSSRRGHDYYTVYITYEVDGTVYERELETDTYASASPGFGANYSVGDKVDIFYNPQDPNIIASPRSVTVGYFYIGVSFVGMAVISYALYCVIKNKHSYLITQKEYEKEKAELKKIRSAKKRTRKKANWIEESEQTRKKKKTVKTVFVIFAVLFGAFICYILFGALLMALGY